MRHEQWASRVVDVFPSCPECFIDLYMKIVQEDDGPLFWECAQCLYQEVVSHQ